MTKSAVDSARLFSALIIDPDSDSAQQLAQALKACGGVASVVADTKEARRALAELKWDVILVNTTAIHSSVLTKELRGEMVVEKSPLLIAVSLDGSEKPGAFDLHLVKPVESTKLNDALQDHFRSRG